VSLKRSRHFMTCGGKFQGEKSENIELYRGLLASPLALPEDILTGAEQIEDC